MSSNTLALFQAVQPKAGTPGVSVAPSDSSPAHQSAPSSPLISFLPILIMLPIIFMMFRKQKKETELRGKLKKGDRVVSQSGLVGELMEMDERFAKVKIAPGTTVQMLATSLSPLDAAAVASKPADKALDDLKEAKIAAEKK